jgi:cell division protein FtsL
MAAVHSPLPAPRPPAARFVEAPRARVAVASALIVAVIILAIALFHVSRRKDILRLGYRLGDARKELKLLREDNRRLRVEQSVLTNPERIERLARSLGMIRPLPGQIRVVDTQTRTARTETAP